MGESLITIGDLLIIEWVIANARTPDNDYREDNQHKQTLLFFSGDFFVCKGLENRFNKNRQNLWETTLK